jgi:hypothetical protein
MVVFLSFHRVSAWLLLAFRNVKGEDFAVRGAHRKTAPDAHHTRALASSGFIRDGAGFLSPSMNRQDFLNLQTSPATGAGNTFSAAVLLTFQPQVFFGKTRRGTFKLGAATRGTLAPKLDGCIFRHCRKKVCDCHHTRSTASVETKVTAEDTLSFAI